MKEKVTVQVKEATPSDIRELIERAGTTIGSVHFKKRKGGELRKMSYRLHVTNPSVASKPKGLTAQAAQASDSAMVCKQCGKPQGTKTGECSVGPFVAQTTAPAKTASPKKSKKDIDIKNDQITVLDANKVVWKDGEIVGRGAWRTIPLENVVRVANKGKTYIIE